MNNTIMMPAQELADRLHEIQDQIRQLTGIESELKNQLAATLKAMATPDNENPLVVGTFGQKYQLAKKAPAYRFAIPKEEFQRLGILEACTPAPKMTKTELDKFLKKGLISYQTVAEWQAEGWYVVEDSGELTIKQLASKAEDVLPEPYERF